MNSPNADRDPRQLTVLPATGINGKVDELKRQFDREGGAPRSTPTLIDRVLDPTMNDDQRIIHQRVVDTLSSIYDPEIPVNIYDLGLIYQIAVDADFNVSIRMTLTAPACPVADRMPAEVREKVQKTPGVESCQVELTWEPPWSRDRMSEAALLELGML